MRIFKVIKLCMKKLLQVPFTNYSMKEDKRGMKSSEGTKYMKYIYTSSHTFLNGFTQLNYISKTLLNSWNFSATFTL